MKYILGIETSCDETGVGIFDVEQKKLLANVFFSQIDLHKEFGGVLPELASRTHLEKIKPITQQALQKAKINLDQIDAYAVTTHPGLTTSLLIGVCFAKSLAFAKKKPLIEINHNHGHIVSSFVDNNLILKNDLEFEHICVSISGGHSTIFLVNSPLEFAPIGNTLDDAAGEAFDKIAKIMDLGYPGGPIIETLAAKKNFEDFFSFPRPELENKFDFSFSGLKTSVLYKLVKLGAYSLKEKKSTHLMTQDLKEKIASSFLVCVRDILLKKIEHALKTYPNIKAVSFVGGVSNNNYLRKELGDFCEKFNKKFYLPPRQLTTDQGGMIAIAAYFKALAKDFSSYDLDIKRFSRL